jgi:hypothetical protein
MIFGHCVCRKLSTANGEKYGFTHIKNAEKSGKYGRLLRENADFIE